MTKSEVAKLVQGGPICQEQLLNHCSIEDIQKLLDSGIIQKHHLKTPSQVLYKNLNSSEIEKVSHFTQKIAAMQQQEEIAKLQSEIEQMAKEFDGIDVEVAVDEHIQKLHDYNDIKDVGQMLFGLCSLREGTTTRSMYERFDMDLND